MWKWIQYSKAAAKLGVWKSRLYNACVCVAWKNNIKKENARKDKEKQKFFLFDKFCRKVFFCFFTADVYNVVFWHSGFLLCPTTSKQSDVFPLFSLFDKEITNWKYVYADLFHSTTDKVCTPPKCLCPISKSYFKTLICLWIHCQ